MLFYLEYENEHVLLLFSYANRAKNIKNQPRINEDPKDALLRKFQEEIARLREQLEKKGKRGKSSRRRQDENGNEVEDDDVDEKADEELYLLEQQDKLEQEKHEIRNRKNLNGLLKVFFRTQIDFRQKLPAFNAARDENHSKVEKPRRLSRRSMDSVKLVFV